MQLFSINETLFSSLAVSAIIRHNQKQNQKHHKIENANATSHVFINTLRLHLLGTDKKLQVTSLIFISYHMSIFIATKRILIAFPLSFHLCNKKKYVADNQMYWRKNRTNATNLKVGATRLAKVGGHGFSPFYCSSKTTCFAKSGGGA